MLIDELRNNIKIALKEKLKTKNDTKYSVYKNILDKTQKDAKEKKTEIITDDYVITAARKELKQLEDTLSYITKESDPDRYEKLTTSIAIVNDFLPKSVSENEILDFLKNNDVDKNMGICMKALKNKFGVNLDGRTASNIVKNYITEK
jgi:uncharacterized protein YqeY